MADIDLLAERPCRVVSFDADGNTVADFVFGEGDEPALPPEGCATRMLHADRVVHVQVYDAGTGQLLIDRRDSEDGGHVDDPLV